MSDGFAQEPQAHGYVSRREDVFPHSGSAGVEEGTRGGTGAGAVLIGLPLTMVQFGVKEIVPETLCKVAKAACVPIQSAKNLRANITADECTTRFWRRTDWTGCIWPN